MYAVFADNKIIAGRPGMGKSSLALSIAIHAASKFKRGVGFISLEMPDEDLAEIAVSGRSGIDSQRLNQGAISEWPAFLEACGSIAELPLYINDTASLSAMELRGEVLRQKATEGLDLLIVDYLQLMRGDRRSQNREQEISFISRSLKILAGDLDIPVIALSQLSRKCEERRDKRPRLSDLRESGSIEQDADAVVFIYRDEIYDPDTEFPNIAEIIVGKNRRGPTGVFSAYFKKSLGQFVDLEVRTHPLDYEQPYPDGHKSFLGTAMERYRNGNGAHQ